MLSLSFVFMHFFLSVSCLHPCPLLLFSIPLFHSSFLSFSRLHLLDFLCFILIIHSSLFLSSSKSSSSCSLFCPPHSRLASSHPKASPPHRRQRTSSPSHLHTRGSEISPGSPPSLEQLAEEGGRGDRGPSSRLEVCLGRVG